MGKFRIKVKTSAQKELKKHYKSSDKSTVKKIKKIFSELQTHPETGTGKPEKLKHELSGYWSRRLNKKDRIIYTIDGNKVIVTIVSVMGHYSS